MATRPNLNLRVRRQLRLWWRETRPTWRLAVPIMAGMMSQVLMGLADTVMVGRVGVVSLAAAALVSAVGHLPLVFGIGLLSSISVLTSQAYGARQPAVAGEILRHGLFLAVGIGVLAALSLVAVIPFLGWLGQPPAVLAEAKPFLLLFGASLLPALIAIGSKQFADALKRPWLPTSVMLGSVGLNIILNWVLIYGHWGAPALGLTGAGWATLIARCFMALVLVVYVLRDPALLPFQPLRWRAPLTAVWIRRLLSLGWPVGAQHFFEVSAFAAAAVMMGWISADAIAAHQIAITCAATTFMSAVGIGAAAGIRVGHAYGAQQFQRMRRIGFGAVALAGTGMLICGIFFALQGEAIAGWFIDSKAVAALTAQLLIVAAVFQVVDGIQVTSISVLRGLGDVRVPAMIAVVAYWLLALPIGAVLAFQSRLGAVGMWIGLATGLGVAAGGLAWRFHRKTLPGRSAVAAV